MQGYYKFPHEYHKYIEPLPQQSQLQKREHIFAERLHIYRKNININKALRHEQIKT